MKRDGKMDRQWDKRVWLWLFWVTSPYSECTCVDRCTGAHHWDVTMSPGLCGGSSRRQQNMSRVVATAQGATGFRDPCIQGASSYGS